MSLLLSLFFLLMLLFPLSIFSYGINEHDRRTILKIRKQLRDPHDLRGWGDRQFCVGVRCTGGSLLGGFADIYYDFDNGRITRLTMEGLHVSAPFPDAICDLTELSDLHIHQIPGLYGRIPSCVVTKLAKINYFSITDTSISGTVPEFNNSTKLQFLILARNQLSGAIPSFLSTLQPYTVMDLSSNHLTTLPPYLPPGYIVFSNNSLTGEIPKSYGLVDFLWLDVSYNNLSGDASFLFGKQKRTGGIILAKNNFEFDLSSVEFSDSLTDLDISHNKIYGKVPESLATATDMFNGRANLSCNRLCGELPQGRNMQHFKAEDFADNACLCGSPLPPCNYSSSPPPPPTYTPPF